MPPAFFLSRFALALLFAPLAAGAQLRVQDASVLAGTCLNCHGPEGRSAGAIPSLRGHTAGYLLAPDKTPDQAWLLGDTLGWSGPWGTTYASNLRLILPRLSEEQWLQLARQAAYRPPMPNHALRIMEEDDLRSIHRFVVQLGAAGQPAPAALAPGQTPAGPAVLFPAPPAP